MPVIEVLEFALNNTIKYLILNRLLLLNLTFKWSFMHFAPLVWIGREYQITRKISIYSIM